MMEKNICGIPLEIDVENDNITAEVIQDNCDIGLVINMQKIACIESVTTLACGIMTDN